MNPYASPNCIPSDERKHLPIGSVALAGLLGLVGFGIAATSQLIFNEYLDDVFGPLILGIVLGSSEFIAARRPPWLDIVRRLMISTLLMVPAGVMAGVISTTFGWQRRSYEHDPYFVYYFGCHVVVYFIAILLVRACFAFRGSQGVALG
jgi:hypothetical protein